MVVYQSEVTEIYNFMDMPPFIGCEDYFWLEAFATLRILNRLTAMEKA
jgi:hypothetical protein